MNANLPMPSPTTGNARPQPFNLWMTTCHPESEDECAGNVVHVPAEFTERTVLIDLHEVTRIDSWGIALFIEAMQRITAHGGHLVLIRLHDDVRRVLETAKLDQVFHICANREEALAEHGRLFAA
jgi:anti-anti-sigma factor